MTIEVYKIDRDGRRTDLVPRYEVDAGDPERLQPDTVGFPRCSCPRCRTPQAVR
ncbi:hypothetical protein [Streptomyces albicerus]|uniref:hypothetical protein n=1 Tax=Streptomyces albicerus TaxID=2569859 RepID=UPI001788C8B0|nr:hypothetical protein [Streptomyces albicerus]